MEQQLLSLLGDTISLTILAYFAFYFKNRLESVQDDYNKHLKNDLEYHRNKDIPNDNPDV